MRPSSQLRRRPLRRDLDPEVVRAADHARPPLLAPVRAPRVADHPVVLACGGVGAVAGDRDRVVERRAARRVLEDAAGVRLELGRHADRAGDRPARANLGDHLLGVRRRIGRQADLKTWARAKSSMVDEGTIISENPLINHLKYSIR